MRLLIVRLSSLGDAIHTLPIAANARHAGTEVTWVIEPAYRELVESNPDVASVLLADTKRWRRRAASPRTYAEIGSFFDRLRAVAPDATIDAQGLWKSAILARAAGAPVVGFAARERREPASSILCDRKVAPAAGGHVVDRNLALAEAAGIPISDRAPDARFLLDRHAADAEEFLSSQPRPYAVYHPGAGRPEKAWGDFRFAEVATLLSEESGLAPVISWGPGDEERARRTSELVRGASVVPRLSVTGLAHVLAGASLFVAGDTGPLHLADALGVRTVGLFGRTDPARNGPYRRPASAFRYGPATRPDEVARKALEVLAA